MKSNFRLTLLLILLTDALCAQTYITNVSVADVVQHRWLHNQTVTISHELITDIRPAQQAKIPANAAIVDGEGKYLIPGLIDAHIHFSQTGGLYTRPDAIDLRKYKPYQEEIDWAHDHMEEVLRRYLQNGITTVMDVGTTINFLKHRDAFKDATYAPSIYMSGPLLTTYEPAALSNLGDDGPFSLVKTVEDGLKMVQQQLQYHPDMIKIWYIVGRDTSDIEASARRYLPIIKAISDEAHKNNLPMAVHATQRITAQLAVENGCDYLVHSVDDELLTDEFVQLLKSKNTILCPTLIVHDGYYNTFGQNLHMSHHEQRMGDPFQLGSLLDLKHLPDTAMINRYYRRINTPEKMEDTKAANGIMLTNLRKLSDAGVIIATGTDAGNIGTLHASSYLTEVLAMQASGMSHWQILEASTINGAKVLRKEKEFGSVSKGKKANMILLEADPTTNIENITKIYRVINKGVVIDPDTLIPVSPVALAQQQLNAYNLRDIDAFLEPYADDIEIYNYPNSLLYKGKSEMRLDYSALFDSAPDLHCELAGRTVKGNVVTDQEIVRFGNRKIEATAIFHTEKGKIQKVYFKQ
ncbi:MAG TPA: amidohydrolase family protein [Saprospiraceae bacterium]|nr:amidohydrolase family protein [Saprospiraceae bacterium]